MLFFLGTTQQSLLFFFFSSKVLRKGFDALEFTFKWSTKNFIHISKENDEANVAEYYTGKSGWRIFGSSLHCSLNFSKSEIISRLKANKMWDNSFNSSKTGCIKKLCLGTSLEVQWLRLCPSSAGGVSSISGQGTKTPPAGVAKKKEV